MTERNRPHPSALEFCESLRKQGEAWLKQEAQSVKNFPTLPSGKKGLVIPDASSSSELIVLLPDGKLVRMIPGEYSLISDVSDRHYTSDALLVDVEREVAKYKKPSNKPPRKRFFFGR